MVSARQDTSSARTRWLAAIAAALLVVALVQLYRSVTGDGRADAPADGRLALAVLGDSDSHSYQDTVAIADDGESRGGAQRAQTLQWTEVLARLRGSEIDPGRWDRWGSNGAIARLRTLFGAVQRRPLKLDYRYNFAVSGAVCDDLLRSGERQTGNLLQLMALDPLRWRHGVVVIRIGINDVGDEESLDAVARGEHREVDADVDACIAEIQASVQQILAAHAQTRIVLVGIFDNVHWPPLAQRWPQALAQQRIATAMQRYDDALKALAAADARLVFFDDTRWFAAHWGGRKADGSADYHAAVLADGRRIQARVGDDVASAVVADGHSGLAWNALWAQALVDTLREQAQLPLTPIGDAELAAFVTKISTSPQK